MLKNGKTTLEKMEGLVSIIARNVAGIKDNMATKDDIANMATKDDIANMATKDDIANMATKDDIKGLEFKIEDTERRLSVKINAIEEKIDDLGDPEMLVYLLKYDSVYGRFNKEISFVSEDGKNYLLVDGHKTLFLQEKDTTKLPWKELGVDIAVEATGVFESYEKAKFHIDQGTKRVVLTAPAKDEDGELGKTVLLGANDEALKTCTISSNGSCTTNSAHPVMQVLSETLGVKKSFLVSTHGYTATQNIVDGPTKSKDMRRGRAAAVNISPSFTGATIAVERAVDAVKGKFGGAAFRVPTITGSISAITSLVDRPTTAEEG